jgi:hypothetical protein
MTAPSPDDEMPSTELAPRRMLDGGAGERERRLLASAQLDRTPSGAKARVAAALGSVLEPHEAPSGAERATRGDALPRSGTRWGFGVVGAGTVGAIALTLWLLPATPGESSNAGSTLGGAALESSAAPPQPSPAAPPRAASTRAAPADLSPHANPAKHEAPPLPDRSRPRRANAEDGANDDERGGGLLAEVRALEAVSSAIGAGQADRAARELAAYRRRFARGELAIEAEVLAIQIAVARGDDAAASVGAERLLARPEAEHYRARVRSLLERRGQPSGSAKRENVGDARSNDAAAHMRARR